MTRTALIVGAGIGGLSAGIALRQAGWNIRIFERAASPRELGFGLGLAPNAIAALRELGVADVGARSRVRAEARRSTPHGRHGSEARGGPPRGARRPDGRGAASGAPRRAARGRRTDAITLSSEATGFTVTGDRVTLHWRTAMSPRATCSSAPTASVPSSARALHPSEPPPRSSGIVAVRGAVHGVLHHLGDLSAVYYLGPGVESMLVRASDTGIYWFLSLARELVPTGMQDPAAILAHMAPRFDATFRAVTSATDDLRYDELVDRDPIPFWSKGVVTLLGDAAHPLLPHTGQGAAQAIVDAVTLAKPLEDDADVERALRRTNGIGGRRRRRCWRRDAGRRASCAR